MRHLLLAVADPGEATTIRNTLGQDRHYDAASDVAAFQTRAVTASRDYELIFLDVGFLDVDGSDAQQCRTALGKVWKGNPHAEIIFLGPQDRVRDMVSLVRAGAADFLVRPLLPEALSLVMEALSSRRRSQGQLNHFNGDHSSSNLPRFMEHSSQAMREVFEKVCIVADTKALVFLLGETGVGKGWLAKLIHGMGRQSSGPFISVHCGAIPETLFESELFGHERGAFTGADRKQIGKLELAADGTVFLDEVGTMTPMQQVKLLEVLQEKSFRRIGGTRDISLTCRVIAATNANLKERLERGDFRKDLYFRLNAFPVTIPPLRKRPEDIPLLVDHFLMTFNRLHGRNIHSLHPYTNEVIRHYAWPGNVRELENVLERACILETSPIIRPENLPMEILCASEATNGSFIDTSRPLEELKRNAVETLERLYLLKLLEKHKGRMDQSAECAGITTRHLRNLVHKYRIDRYRFKSHH